MNTQNTSTGITLPESHVIKKQGIKLIGIHGHAGAGKDTIAQYLNQLLPRVVVWPFAAFLKEAAAVAFGIDRSMFDSTDHKERSNTFWNLSPRQMAQLMGTEMFRKVIGEDFWIKRMAGELNEILWPGYDPVESGDIIVIPDVRFQNEHDFVIGNGGQMIHVTRSKADGKVGIANHESEAGFTFTRPDQVWSIQNNFSLEELKYDVTQFCKATYPEFIS